MKIASFLSISFFPSCKQQSRTKIDTNIVFFSIDILFPPTKLSLTNQTPNQPSKKFFSQPLSRTNPKKCIFLLPKPYLQVTFLSQIINNVSTQPFNTLETKHKKYPQNLI